ncbi:MAG: competence/damage-inducible protein A [Candidatus Aminicenantes bacterium]|nr:competence/damage-inducible protein A [Candidatus Aminicenantes bacterium]
MRAIFIAVGSELLEKDRLDTNSLYVARKLREKGILMDLKMTVGDDLDNLTWVIKNAYKRAQLVIITGGLGPTEDDLTREGTANALKKELVFQEEIVEQIRSVFEKRGIQMPDINARQAFIIKGAEVLPNSVGTAPGQYIEDKSCNVLLLPGPPREMQPMFDDIFIRKIAPLSNFHIHTRCLKFSGITESETDSRISDLYSKYNNPRTTILASPGIIEVHLLGRSKKSPEENKKTTDSLAEKIKERLAEYFITEKDISFEQYILEELRSNHLTLSTAESCTGGGLGNRITNIPGSSDVFLGGVIAYSNELKMKILGVSKGILEKYGAVSKQTAQQMAQGIREKSHSDIGVAITGIAGPTGATKGKPVGLVCLHLSSLKTEQGSQKIFSGDRQVIKTRSENFCLNLIRKYLKQRKN